MGAISSEIVHLLKVRLSLQNDQRWLLLLSWFSKFFGEGFSYFLGFQNFSGEDPRTTLARLDNMLFIFQFNTVQHKP